jgi:hypothetical protein
VINVTYNFVRTVMQLVSVLIVLVDIWLLVLLNVLVAMFKIVILVQKLELALPVFLALD